MNTLSQHREQYVQRFHEQMQYLQKEVNRVRAMAFSANSYIQGEMNKLVAQLDRRVQTLTEKMVKFAENGDETVYSALEQMESAWGSLRSSAGDMLARLREKREQATQKLEEGVDEARQALSERSQREQQTQQSQGRQQGARASRGQSGRAQAEHRVTAQDDMVRDPEFLMPDPDNPGSQSMQQGGGAAQSPMGSNARRNAGQQQGQQERSQAPATSPQEVEATIVVTRTPRNT